MLVGPQIERADRDRLSGHPLGNRAIGLELLVLRRESVAIQKQKFRAEKSDAGGAVVERLLDIVGQLDVRVQFHFDAVDRFGGLGA